MNNILAVFVAKFGPNHMEAKDQSKNQYMWYIFSCWWLFVPNM